MKKVFVLIITIILALSMVSCNIQEFVSGWGTTSTTSCEMTTTTTTLDPEFKTLQELVSSIEYVNAKYYFTSVDHSLNMIVKDMIDIDGFLQTYIFSQDYEITTEKYVVENIRREANNYAKNAEEYYKKVIFSIALYNGASSPVLTIHIYSNGTAHGISELGEYVTLNGTELDWKGIMEEYFYYGVEL